MTVRNAVWRLGAIAKRDLLIELSYRFRLILLFTTTFASAFLAYFVSQLVGDSEQLAAFDGSYFEYVVIGLALTSYATLAVTAFNQRIMREQQAGTFEVLLASPASLGTLLAGGFVIPLALTTLEVVALVGLGVGLIGVGLTTSGLIVSVPILLLTIVNFCALGIGAASLVVLAKRGDPISGPLAQATLLLSGAIFPIELFPGWLQVICRLTPGYYGVRGMREALLTDGGFTGVVDEILILTGFAVVLVPISLAAFARAIRTAKRLGILASY